jgi:hypothetical protein
LHLIRFVPNRKALFSRVSTCVAQLFDALAPVAFAHGFRPWLSPMAFAHGFRPWLSPMAFKEGV